MRKYLFMVMLFFLPTIRSINALENDVYVNNNGIIISNLEYNNLINSGYSSNEISNMTQSEFNENKDLIGQVVAQTTKYYRVETFVSNNQYFTLANKDKSYTSISYEISESEFNNAKSTPFESSVINASAVVETTYKKMTTSIVKYNSNYRYKNVVLWKKLPAYRVNDIIGVGFEDKVYGVSSSKRLVAYYIYDDSCDVNITNTGTWKLSANGYAVSFDYPTKSKNATNENFYVEMYFDVGKNTSLTINTLNAYGDYKHLIGSKSHVSTSISIDLAGISVGASFESYYDSISTAQATLTNINW